MAEPLVRGSRTKPPEAERILHLHNPRSRPFCRKICFFVEQNISSVVGGGEQGFLLLELVECMYAGDGCGDWLNLTDVHSAGGTRLSQFYTVELCLHACRDLLDNCVGVDIDSRPHDEIRCWIHSNFEDFAETYRAVGLTQYRLVMPCVQPSNIHTSLYLSLQSTHCIRRTVI